LRAIAEKEEVAVAGDELDAAVERLAFAAQQSGQGDRGASFARSERIRGMLESELFERQLADRLIDIATEGRGAVVNPWTPPAVEAAAEAPEVTPTEEASTTETTETEGGESAEQT
jgi:hypothetical protein